MDENKPVFVLASTSTVHTLLKTIASTVTSLSFDFICYKKLSKCLDYLVLDGLNTNDQITPSQHAKRIIVVLGEDEAR